MEGIVKAELTQLIIGNTFMKTVGVRIFPQLGGVMIMNKVGPSFVRG